MPRRPLALLALFLAAPAPAAFLANHPDAVLLVPSHSIDEPVEDARFSVLLWIRPGDASPGELLRIEDEDETVIVSIDRPAADAARAAIGEDAPPSLIVRNLAADAWSLVALSVDDDLARLFVAIDGAGVAEDVVLIDPDELPGDAALVRLGAGDEDAVTGLYGLAVVRDHPLSRADVEALAASTDFLAAFRRDDASGEQQMNGTEGAAWMIGHAMSTLPNNRLGYSSDSSDRAAVVGEPVTRFNTHVYDRDASVGSDIRAVRAVEETAGFTHVSPFEDGRFHPAPPTTDAPLPPSGLVPALAPTARSLLAEPDGLVRVMVSSNSRGVQRSDGSGGRSANYADGFIESLYDRVAGVLFRPAVSNRHPWAAFSTTAGGPWRAGVVDNIGSTDFARFFTGSASAGGPGPGDGLMLGPDSGYALRTAPFARAAASDPLVVRAHLLSYPGAAAVRWTPNHHTRQSGPGQDDGAATPLHLDATLHTHVFAPDAGDELDDRTLALASPLPGAVEVGHAVAHAGGITLIEAVATDASGATITLTHPWRNPPVAGGELRFGPWALTTIHHEWGPVDGSRDHRGLKIETDPAGWAVPVFAFDAWNPDAAGFLFGTAGWGGNGYDTQLDEAHPDATRAWMTLTQADVWLQVFAQQDSTPASTLRYTNEIRAALPEAEVLWLGETEHGTGTSEDWHAYILANAQAHNVPAISLLLDPRFGILDDQIAAGLRSNSAHYSGAGADALASAWLEKLADAALAPGPDLNNDGVVDAADLAQLIGQWGACAAPCLADLDGDGAVGAADLAQLISAWD